MAALCKQRPHFLPLFSSCFSYIATFYPNWPRDKIDNSILSQQTFILFFFLAFLLMDTDDSLDRRGREGPSLFPSATSTRSITPKYTFKPWRKYTVVKYQFKVINEDLSTKNMFASVYIVEFEQIFSKSSYLQISPSMSVPVGSAVKCPIVPKWKLVIYFIRIT